PTHFATVRASLRQGITTETSTSSALLRSDGSAEGRRMIRVFVQHHGHMPTPIMPMNEVQKGLEILRRWCFLLQEQATSALNVEDAKDDPLGVGATNRYGAG